MKILEYIKTNEEQSTKFFKFNIYRNMKLKRKQYILNGLITIIKKYDKYHHIKIKYIKFLNKTIIKNIENGEIRLLYILNIPIIKQSSISYYSKRITKKINKKYDDIYFIIGNSGEMYAFLTYFASTFIQRNRSKNPLIVGTQSYHSDIIKMIMPQIANINIKYSYFIKQNIFKIGKQRFFIIFNDYYLKDHIKKINTINKEMNYFKFMRNELNLNNEELIINKISISKEEEKNMSEKVNEIGLNIEKFIFIAPEAKSFKLTTNDFWKEIIKELESKEYDIFLNINDNTVTKNELSLNNKSKSCFLTFAQAFALAKRAKKIITLRSGFSEILMQTGTIMDVVYSERNLYNYHNLKNYTKLKEMGEINNYLVCEETTKEELKNIVKEICLIK